MACGPPPRDSVPVAAAWPHSRGTALGAPVPSPAMTSEWVWIWSGLVAVASVAGGLLPWLLKWTHRRLQMALSFVSGVMLGVAVFHMLPHAVMARGERATGHEGLEPVMVSMAGGFLAMFLLARFADFHHHEAPGQACEHGHDHGPARRRKKQGDGLPRLTWAGAAVGMTVHGLLEGVAIASSVMAATTLHPGLAAAGVGTFLVILLHKPFDAMTLTTLFRAGEGSQRAALVLNAAFALVVPVGAGLFLLLGSADPAVVSAALAFSAGTFLCIAGSDLLPELQFHRHDRVSLSALLVLGLALAWGVGRLEARSHEHGPDCEHDHAGHVHAGAASHAKETTP
jgi:zinc and cadmium transporter